MYELISSCPRCGNPIYSCNLNHQQPSKNNSAIVYPKDILPQVLRTCACSFDNQQKEKTLEDRMDALELMFSQLLNKLATVDYANSSGNTKSKKIIKD